MNRQDFIDMVENTYKQALQLIVVKNSDYSTDTNPFRNFEYAQYVNVKVEDAIMVRMSDKMARIANLMRKKDRAVLDERIEDTLLDLINYTAILKAYLETRDNQTST